MRRLLLTLLSVIVLFLFTACGDKSTGPEQGEKLTEALAVSAVSQVVKERGLYSSSSGQAKVGNMPDRTSNVLSLGKYYDVDVESAGRVDVSFDIGPDGNIIPDGSWRDNNPDFCRDKIRYMKGAQKKLNYKVFPFNDGWDVFVQYIDVPTSEVENQREGQSPNPNLEGLKDAINNAMDNFEPDVKPATGPCGEKFPLKFVLTSHTTLEGVNTPEGGTADIAIEDEVEAEVPLTYNDQKNIYEGSGEITWVEYDVRDAESSQEINCSLPGPQNFNIPQFYDGTVDSLNQGNKLVHIGPINWGLPRPTCTITYDGNSSSTQFFKAFSYIWGMVQSPTLTQISESDQNINAYAVENWQEVPNNSDVIARREYDRTETTDTLGFKTYIEETTMEIRRDFQSN